MKDRGFSLRFAKSRGSAHHRNSAMGSLFSKTKKTVKVTARDRAILELKVQRDRLKQYQKRIAMVLERETEIAKQQLAAGHKDRALLALRRKKYQQGLLEKTDQQLLNLEQLTSNIEFKLVEQQVLQGLKTGNEILGELQKEMKIEEVEKLMEETAEAQAYQQEISQMLSGRMNEKDEDDVERELAELIELELPSVPVKIMKEATKAESIKEERRVPQLAE